MSRSDDVRALQEGVPQGTAVEVFMSFLRQLNEHVDHPWKQIRGCVYCDTCNVRLYQGKALTESEKTAVRKAVREADGA